MKKKTQIGIITQARINSTRLPRKVLLKIKNKTLLSYHLDRLKQSQLPVFVAIANEPGAEDIATECTQNDTQYFLGDPANVLKRFFECALKYQLDHVIRVTSDCPIIDGGLIKKFADRYMSENSTNAYHGLDVENYYPRGLDFEIFSFKSLENACQNATTSKEKEHVTPYFYQTKPEKFETKYLTDDSKNSDLRLTVDTPEDFELISRLIENHQAHQKTYVEIIKILRNYPELTEVNKTIEQKQI